MPKDKAVDIELSLTTGRPKSQQGKGVRALVYVLAIAAALGGMIFGYDIGGSGGTFVMDSFKEQFHWAQDNVTVSNQRDDSLDQGMINGLFGLGAIFGALFGPLLADKYGRRPCLITASTIFIVGATVQATSNDMDQMWIGRFVGGIGIGMLSMCAPIYISEASPEHARGKLATLWQLATTIGIVVAAAANIGLEKWEPGWRLSYAGNIPFAVGLIVSMLCLPESPRWLASKDKTEELRIVLKKLRFEDEIEPEFTKLTTEVEEERHLGASTWAEMWSDSNRMRYRVVLGASLQMFQQLSGINAVMFYAPTIFTDFFSSTVSLWGNLGLQFINVLATFITIYAIDKHGRVKLLLAGGSTMVVTLAVLLTLSSLDNTLGIGIAVLGVTAVFIISFAYSWGPVVWVVCSELMPVRARGKGAGLTTASNWLFTAIVGAIFPTARAASLPLCFAFFGIVIAVGTVVVYLYLPETAHLSPLQVDSVFHDHTPKLHRTGLLGKPSAKAGDEVTPDELALEAPGRIPSSRFERRTGDYQYDSSYLSGRGTRASEP